MRFGKSIKIAKGARLNFSKSGISMSAGMKGVSLNVGSRGTFLTSGIPGTGIYDRKKIGSDISVRTASDTSELQNGEIAFTIDIDDSGKCFIKDQDGNTITNESITRAIKRTQSYKDIERKLSETFADDKNAATSSFIEIYKQSAKVASESEVKEQLASLQPQVYMRRHYDGAKPDENLIRSNLKNEAKKKISSLAFWKNKKLRQDFIEKEFPIRLQIENEKYKKAVLEFNEKEALIESDKNREYNEQYLCKKRYIENVLRGKKEFVESSIDAFLNSMSLPVDFEVSYEYDEAGGLLTVDLDLPEIEDVPQSKAVTLASGKVKVKDKTQKEIREQYPICVTGLAFFFSSHLFNFSTVINEILLSGYTQRISKRTGTLADEYVYSILLTREKLEKINFENIIPYMAFEEFEHVIDYTKTFELKTVKPLNYRKE